MNQPFQQLNFNARAVAPATGAMDPIPASWQDAMIDESEIKPTSNGSGKYLQLRFTVIGGKYAGRKIYSRLNIENANPQTVEIAYQELSAVCHAIGVYDLQGTTQSLHGIPMKIKVAVRKGNGEYEPANVIRAYRNINDPDAIAAKQKSDAQLSVTTAPAAGGFAPPAAPMMPAAPAVAPAPAYAPAVAPAVAPAAVPAAAQPWQQPPAAPAPAAPVPAPVAAQPAWATGAPVQPAAAPAAAPAAPATVAPAHVAGAQPPWMTQPAQ